MTARPVCWRASALPPPCFLIAIVTAASPPIVSATFAACVAWRCLQGLAAGLPVALLCAVDVPGWPVSAVSMGLSAMLIGLGIGVAADRWLRTQWSAVAAIRTATTLLITGLWLLWLFPDVEATVSVCLFTGLGVGGEWSTLADACRGELSARTRWNGIRVWTAAFALGLGISGLLPVTAAATFTVASIATVVAGWLLRQRFSFVNEPEVSLEEAFDPATQSSEPASSAALSAAAATEAADSGASDDNATNVETTSVETPDSQTTDSHTSSDDATDCDATDCCGGSKPVVPTRFSQGVLLASTAWCILLSALTLMFAESDALLLRLALGTGLTVGSLLMFTTAPRTGYVVALLPFLLLLNGLLLATFFVTDLPQRALFVLAVATAAAAVHCGLRLVMGESFSDCSSDPVRTRVLVVALFAAAAVILLESAVRRLLPAGGWQVLPLLMMIVTGIATIRTLPAPVVSSLGDDNPENPDPDELNDVLAIVNEQV